MSKQFDSLIYLHTHAVSATELARAIRDRQALELDISVDDHRRNYIGHPLSWYVFHRNPLPQNIALPDALATLERTDAPVVLDIKDYHEADTLVRIVEKLGADRCIIHAFASDLVFDERESTLEPHRQNENIPTEALRKIKSATHCPMILSARGLNANFLDNKDAIVKRLKLLQPMIDYFNPYLSVPYDTDTLQHLLAPYGIGQLIDIDMQTPPHHGHWIGFTDEMSVSRLSDR